MTSTGIPPRFIAEYEVSRDVQYGKGENYIRDVFTNNPLISQRFKLHTGEKEELPPFIDMAASSMITKTGVDVLVLIRLRNKGQYSSYLDEASAFDSRISQIRDSPFVKHRDKHATIIRTLWIPVGGKVKVLLWADNKRVAWSHECLITTLFHCAPLTRKLFKPCVVQWTDDRYLSKDEPPTVGDNEKNEELRKTCSLVGSLLVGQPYPSSREYDYADKIAQTVYDEIFQSGD